MTIVIVGGGPTGVELAGAFAELTRKALKITFRHIDTAKARIVLVEAAPRILGMYSEDLSAYAEKRLEQMGVEVRTNSPVLNLGKNRVDLDGETIHAENIVWSAGVEAPPVTRTLGVELDKAGRVVVAGDLSIPGFPNVFAIGDIASCTDRNGVRVPPLAPAAIQMGRHVAGIIRKERRIVLGDDLTPYAGLLRCDFAYFDKGTMATIGRSAAVAVSMGMKFRGFIAWCMWLFIHLILLVGLRNKLAVLLQWFWAYTHYQPGARIITEPEEGNEKRSGG
jgi:NADH dehydrogenase